MKGLLPSSQTVGHLLIDGRSFCMYLPCAAGYPQMGSDQITCKIFYQPALVEPIGTLAVLNNSVDATYQDIQRPTQAQSFKLKSSGANFTFVIAHLKSKGSACDSLGDPDKGAIETLCFKVDAAGSWRLHTCCAPSAHHAGVCE